MRAMTVAGLALLLALAGGCKDEDEPNGMETGGSGQNTAASGGSTGSSGSSSGEAGKAGSAGGTATMGSGSGSGGGGASSGSEGGSGTAPGSGGKGGDGDAGSDEAGSGSGGSSAGSCDLDCADGEHCELVEVTCVRAPCDPVPMCVADSGGAGSGGSGSGSGRTCGTRGSGTCPDGEYCLWPAGANCGRADAPGKCAEQPSICTREYDPVCGCDGETYSNPCTAASAGVSVETQGECQTSRAGKTDCDPRKAACDEQPEPCPEGQVRAVDGSCYGDCVAIEACACSEPDACPDRDHHTCHNSAGHCGPYV